MRTALAAVAVVACVHGHDPEPHVATPGLTISLYTPAKASAYAIVDDRRWLELAPNATELALDNVDDGAEIASMLIEPLGGSAFRIDRCSRPELALPPPDGSGSDLGGGSAADEPPHLAPIVRCHVAGAAAGRHLIRVLYQTTAITYRGEHDIELADPEHARVASRFAVATPHWGGRGELVLFDGAPGGATPPREVVRGVVALDGSVAVLSAPPRVIGAHVRRIFDGAVASPDVDPSAASWHAESTHAVWVWLELAIAALGPGELRVHVDLPDDGARDIDADRAIEVDGAVRIPLWADPMLSGVRQRVGQTDEPGVLVERFTLSVANLGDAARDVWIEEQVRPAHRRRLTNAEAPQPRIHGDVLRTELSVAPRAIDHVRYTVEYEQ